MLRKLIPVVASPMFVFFAVAALAQPGDYSRGWGWEGPGPWHMWAGGWGFWWVFPLLMMVFMVVCVLVAMRMFGGHAPFHRDVTSSALQVLSERFARGEISKEEFEEKRSILTRRT